MAENNTKSSVKRENRVEERRKEKSEFSAQKFIRAVSELLRYLFR